MSLLARRRLRAGRPVDEAGAGPFTGVRPVFGECNHWYVNRVARESRRTFRERQQQAMRDEARDHRHPWMACAYSAARLR